MEVTMLAKKNMPYCPGCGHHSATINLAKGLEKAGFTPLDVVLASDIGCCGIIDDLMSCHTVHGLHGRSVALGVGISVGLNNPQKKVITVQGDGGATIGLQHLMEACRRNINMTLIIMNNMVYGMTGGQVSGLTNTTFKESILPDEGHVPPYDIIELAHKAGAAYAARIIGKGEFSDKLAEAFSVKGFSVVEIMEPCPSYAYGSINNLIELGYTEKILTNKRDFIPWRERVPVSLFDHKKVAHKTFTSILRDRYEIIIAGSAGEGVQLAGDLLAQAGMYCGLNTTKKGEYPITVGTGFSLSEVILSRGEIYYTGIEEPDLLLVTSMDGWQMVKNKVKTKTLVIIDSSIEIPDEINAVKLDFRNVAGRKGACLATISYWMMKYGILPYESILATIEEHKHREGLTVSLEVSRKFIV
jgi:pyruvate/2-oxoacid:ferredoxin oxidoreductase beta subunit/Pyruvate/2-oxoacid:ferredoxin oxidoreductase gamma subunit